LSIISERSGNTHQVPIQTLHALSYYSSDVFGYVHHLSRVLLFSASLEGRPDASWVKNFYIKHAGILVPPQNYEAELGQIAYKRYTEIHSSPPNIPLTKEEKCQLLQGINLPTKTQVARRRVLEIKSLDESVITSHANNPTDLLKLLLAEKERVTYFRDRINLLLRDV